MTATRRHARDLGPIRPAGVYAILDLPYPHPLAPDEIVSALIDGGVGLVQLRAKQATRDQRRAWAELIGRPCRAANVPLILNDDLELAESGEVELAAVHLGQSDLAKLGPDPASRAAHRTRLRALGVGLGVSTHSLDQAREAIVELDPDYLGFGPVFATTTKLDPDPVVGLDPLARVCAGSQPNTPIVAIGGIDAHRAIALRSTGVMAIAVIGALVAASLVHIRSQTEALVRAFAG